MLDSKVVLAREMSVWVEAGLDEGGKMMLGEQSVGAMCEMVFGKEVSKIYELFAGPARRTLFEGSMGEMDEV